MVAKKDNAQNNDAKKPEIRVVVDASRLKNSSLLSG